MSDRKCSVEGCEHVLLARGLCNTHYRRLVRHGNTSVGRAERPKCGFSGCDRAHYGHGFCNIHYRRWVRHGDPNHRNRAANGERAEWLRRNVGYVGDECLIWPFPTGGQRAQTTVDGTQMLAATAMCEMAHGPKPFEDAVAAHWCGKGDDGCVHPQHVRWASVAENALDRWGHGTMIYGEEAPWAKLTNADVLAIANDARSPSDIAKEYGCSPQAVCSVQSGRSWSWLTGIAKPKPGRLLGEKCHFSVLTDSDVLAIYNDRRTRRIIAKEYGCSRAAITAIWNGHTWSHVTGHKRKE